MPLLLLMAARAPAQTSDPGEGFLDAYFRRVDRAQAEQPHWGTPLFTTTPRLTERFRFDNIWQSRPNGVDLANYGAGKGLELILLERVAVTLGIPAYFVRTTPRGTQSGWADETFLVKYRIASANEQTGNYIVTAFLGVSAPTGSEPFTAGKTIFTPTMAAGKGWGSEKEGFNIQSTLGVNVPTGDKSRIGVPIVWNTTFQAHVLSELFWPEVEMNLTHWSGGPNDGRTQAIATFGFVIGRIPIAGRLRANVGAGYQVAVSSYRTYDHAWLVTLRVPF
jgi:hypothetical protein